MCVTGTLFLKQKVYCATLPPPTNHLSISLCSPSLYDQSLPVRFPTTYCTATVAGYSICRRQGRKTCLKDTDSEMMMMSGVSWKVMQFCPFLFNRPFIPFMTYFSSSKITWVKPPGVRLLLPTFLYICALSTHDVVTSVDLKCFLKFALKVDSSDSTFWLDKPHSKPV